MPRKSVYARNQNNITVRMRVVVATGTWDGDWSMLAGYTLQLLSCCLCEAATNQGLPETARKNGDVYNSTYAYESCPPSATDFFTPSATHPAVTVTAPKWFPDARIDNQATNPPATHFQGIGCGRFLWSSRSTCLTLVKWWQQRMYQSHCLQMHIWVPLQ